MGSVRKEIRCVETGETYSSIHDAAKAIGSSYSNFRYALKDPKHTTNGMHWEYTGKEANLARRVRNLETGEIYHDAKEAAEKCGMKLHITYKMLRHKRKFEYLEGI